MPKVIDLTGKRFGNLTVIEMAGRTKRGEITWRCQCDCGNEKNVVGGSLKNGYTKSCGCIAKETVYKCTDLTGKRFGRLLVIKRAENEGKGVMWLCKCDCGNEIIASGRDMKRGHKKSCGCYKHECISRRTKTYLIENIIGKRYGRLTVVEYSHSYIDIGKFYWKCRCDCGDEITVCNDDLENGKTKSCRNIACKYGVDGVTNTTNASSRRLRGIHKGMLERCYGNDYNICKNYSKRGITICNEWLGENGFANFVKWSLTNGYSDKLTIDRIDNNRGYSPCNCRWTTMKVQNNNKRSNVYIEYNGTVKTISEWADYSGLKYSCLYARIKKGWDIGEALNTPSGKQRNISKTV